VRLDGIPTLLRQMPHWILWRYAKLIDVDGRPQWTPAPLSVVTGGPARVAAPATWTDLASAADAVAHHSCEGLAFVLHRSPEKQPDQPGLVALVLDHCRDPHTERIDDWASGVVQAIGSYTELSPDGTGLRILLLGNLPAHGRRKG